MSEITVDDRIKGAVREAYGNLARRFTEELAPGSRRSCCGPSGADAEGIDPVEALDAAGIAVEGSTSTSCCGPSETSVEATGAARFYSADELAGLPDTVTGASAGCGNPLAIAEIQRGEVVLDLGSGGGIDCFLAARRVGPEGKVIGLDMTPEMIKLARRNAKKIGVPNVDFRYGEMEEMPLPDESVDVVLSNCVINLSPDKDAVFREAFRVLRPGGRMSVSDIVVDGQLPEPIRDSLNAWAGCLAGALDEADYLAKIRAAGFRNVDVVSHDYAEVEIAQVAQSADGQALLDCAGCSLSDLTHKVASIKVKAHKPA